MELENKSNLVSTQMGYVWDSVKVDRTVDDRVKEYYQEFMEKKSRRERERDALFYKRYQVFGDLRLEWK